MTTSLNQENAPPIRRIHPEDRRGREPAPPPDWTIFNPADRDPPVGVVADLENLDGWTAAVSGCDAVAFGLTTALPLWGAATTFVDIPASATPVTVILRPPTPAALPPGAERAEIWVKGDWFDYQGTAPGVCSVRRSIGPARRRRRGRRFSKCSRWSPTAPKRFFQSAPWGVCA